MRLYYTKQAKKWEETLPIGNGSLGAMIFGGIEKECLGLNEESLWSGYERDKNNKEAANYLETCRRMVEAEKYVEAERLIQEYMLGEYNESYLPLGNLYLAFSHGNQVVNYERSLDIEKSIATVRYESEDTKYKREYFASYPSKAIFIKLSCSKPNINVDLSFESNIRNQANYMTNGIHIKGKCPEHVEPSYIQKEHPIIQGEKGMEFKASLKILACDGVVKAEENILKIQNASKVILSFSAVQKEEFDPHLSYEALKQFHQMDYKSIYDKVELYLGEQINLPTNERLDRLKKGEKDNGLYALYFQYGRYLLISSSRKGSLPANLQGIWSWELRAPWSCNWTTNINTQMNYWHAQSCNLTECLPPYFEFVKKICEEGKKTARIHYHCRGFVHHHNADYWCNTNPVGLVQGEEKGRDHTATWSMWPMGGAWLTSELFKHYEYNLDYEFLKETVYPIVKEAACFLLDWMYEWKGQYVTCPSTSPENRFLTKEGKTSAIAMSSTMDLCLIREVFGNFQKTCEILQINDELLEDIEERLKHLTPFYVGSKGQLLEWHKEFKESEPGHRHISHLYGLFPSELWEGNEAMTNACKKSLQLRLENGGGHTGWSCAWMINMFAILGDAKQAFQYLNTLLTRSSYDNLWDAHPPFQIDGNFGGTAGIANMLVQDRKGKIKILPALPSESTAGYVKGLCIKNNKTIDISWENGKVTNYEINFKSLN